MDTQADTLIENQTNRLANEQTDERIDMQIDIDLIYLFDPPTLAASSTFGGLKGRLPTNR